LKIIIILIMNGTYLMAQYELSNKIYDKYKIDTKMSRDSAQQFESLNNNKVNRIEFAKVEIETTLIGNYLYALPPYPLPSKGIVNTVIYWDTILDINKADMSVYNMDCEKICGKERISLVKLNDYNGIVTWNGFGYQSGIYFLIIKHGTRTALIKMIIE
jgi:hypothetical protein